MRLRDDSDEFSEEFQELRQSNTIFDDMALKLSTRFKPSALRPNELKSDFIPKIDLVTFLVQQTLLQHTDEKMLEILNDWEIERSKKNNNILKSHDRLGGRYRAYLLMIHVLQNVFQTESTPNLFCRQSVDTEEYEIEVNWSAFIGLSNAFKRNVLKARFTKLKDEGTWPRYLGSMFAFFFASKPGSITTLSNSITAFFGSLGCTSKIDFIYERSPTKEKDQKKSKYEYISLHTDHYPFFTIMVQGLKRIHFLAMVDIMISTSLGDFIGNAKDTWLQFVIPSNEDIEKLRYAPDIRNYYQARKKIGSVPHHNRMKEMFSLI